MTSSITPGPSGGLAAVVVLALAGASCQAEPHGPTTVDVDYATVFQTLEGFGAVGAYDTAELAAFGRTNPAIYDDLFGTSAAGQGLGLDIFRIRNTYQYDGDTNLAAVGAIVAAAKARNPALKISMAAWSPPAGLKSNGDIDNGGTIVKSGGAYDYASYADWWANSLTVGWADVGVVPDSICLQNEPDIATSYDSCLFAPSENDTYAGFATAFDAVHDAIAARVGTSLAVMPSLIGPESIGYAAGPGNLDGRGARDYIDKLTPAGKAAMAAYAIHPYADAGGGLTGWDHPDNHLSAMRDFAADARYNDKPVWMTEYCRLSDEHTFDEAIKLAWHIHNFLVEMRAAAYVHFPLFRAASISNGGMVNFDDAGNTYAFLDLYYFFKHYSYFTDPGWAVVASKSNSDNLRVTAFRDPDGHRLTVVLLNKSGATETFPLSITGFAPATSQVFLTSATEHWVPQASYLPDVPLTVPPSSIVTIALADD